MKLRKQQSREGNVRESQFKTKHVKISIQGVSPLPLHVNDCHCRFKILNIQEYLGEAGHTTTGLTKCNLDRLQYGRYMQYDLKTTGHDTHDEKMVTVTNDSIVFVLVCSHRSMVHRV